MTNQPISNQTQNNCVFCKIIAGELPSQKLYQDQSITAFRDINPVATTHVLVVPNKHIPSTNELAAEDEQLVGRLFTIARQLAEDEGIEESGYRLIINTGPDAGQEVFHLHLHLIGGRRMGHLP
jgi:histidine triad (HIT) family protein